MNQAVKAGRFCALHARSSAFIIPNPWDAGSAKLLAHLGFEALATTSAGYAFSLGRPDNAVVREVMLKHVAEIATATDLPVSADLEHGYGDTAIVCAETIRLAAGVGAVGGSIEDSTGRSGSPIYGLEAAAERIRAAAEAAHGGTFPFILTARAENYLVGRPDLKDTIARLQAYQEAGADVLYAPGLTSKEDIATLVRSVDRPVNVVMGLQGVRLTLAELSALGVRRVSVGSALARAAWGAVFRAVQEMRAQGSFGFADQAATYRDLNTLFRTIAEEEQQA